MNRICRLSNFEFRGALIARNRIVVPPMASASADLDGYATSKTIEHYLRLALSGAGLIFVEYSYVHLSGRSEPNQLGADCDSKIQGLAQIREVIKKSGALSGLQLVHSGGKTETSLTDGTLQAPSAVATPVKGRDLQVPSEMSVEQIKLWKTSFVSAATRAARAGFDFIELHCAHGYGLNQWISPLTNQRHDEYGGALENRCRLLFEIIAEIRALHPSLLLSVRLPAQDHMEGGLSATESAWIVKELEDRGIDLIDVSSGIGGWRRPDGRSGEGYLVGEASYLKRFTSRPVIGVGGIESGEFIDLSLKRESLDFAAVGRAILSDPEGFRNRVLNIDAEHNSQACEGFLQCL